VGCRESEVEGESHLLRPVGHASFYGSPGYDSLQPRAGLAIWNLSLLPYAPKNITFPDAITLD